MNNKKTEAPTITEVEIKEIRDDLYYTLEGMSGCKSTARAILKDFDYMFEKLGDTLELYDYYTNRV